MITTRTENRARWVCFLFVCIFHQSSGMTREERRYWRDQVKEMFYHGYDSYLNNAFPLDELRPISCDGVNTWANNSLTLIDSLDTLLVMGNHTEFSRVVHWIGNNFDFEKDVNVSVFEVNIRVLGGLLSAHLLIEEGIAKVEHYDGCLFRLSLDLGRRLLKAFDSPTGIPYGTVNLNGGIPPNEIDITCTATAGTLYLEFAILSRLSGDDSFERAARKSTVEIWNRRSASDLFGNHINITDGSWMYTASGIGGSIDSIYEYLLKSAIFFGDDEMFRMFQGAYRAAETRLRVGHFYIEVDMNTNLYTSVDFNNLQAFWPGMQVLYGDVGNAVEVARSFWAVWKQQGFPPERLNLLTGRSVQGFRGWPLRPELIESFYYLSRATPFDDQWLRYGAEIVESIQKQCRTECGYAGIRDVEDMSKTNTMESFFLAETIKYLYLLFDDENWVEDRNVIFNTEAHIFPINSKFYNEKPSEWFSKHMCPIEKVHGKSSIGYLNHRKHFEVCSSFLQQKPQTPPEKKEEVIKMEEKSIPFNESDIEIEFEVENHVVMKELNGESSVGEDAMDYFEGTEDAVDAQIHSDKSGTDDSFSGFTEENERREEGIEDFSCADSELDEEEMEYEEEARRGENTERIYDVNVILQ